MGDSSSSADADTHRVAETPVVSGQAADVRERVAKIIDPSPWSPGAFSSRVTRAERRAEAFAKADACIEAIAACSTSPAAAIGGAA